jgi:ATP-dependent DNA helicase RecQ
METEKHIIRDSLAAYERSVASIVLYGVSELPFPLGVKRIIDLLKGNRNAFALNNELNLLDTFSALPGYTRDQLSDLFDLLINRGYLEVDMIVDEEEELPVIALTGKGLAFLSGKEAVARGILDILMDKDNPEIPENDQDLFYKLKLARRQLAEEYDYPAFMVCSDQVLKDMCLRKPTEPDDLLKIQGVDMAFMKHYSKQFLYVIRQYVTREKGS